MTSLDETLPALTALMDELPAWTDRLAKRGETNEAAANALLQEIAARRGTTEEWIEVADQVEEDLDRQAQLRRVGLDDKARSVEEVVELMIRAAETDGEEFRALGLTFEEGMEGLARHLEDSSDRVREGQDAASTGFTGIQDVLQRGQETLDAALAAASEGLQSLREAAARARAEVGDAASTLSDRLGALLEEGRRQVASTESTLRGHLDAQAERLADLSDRLQAGADTLVDAVRLRVEEEVRERLVSATRTVADAVQVLAGAAADAQEAAASAGADLAARFDELEQALLPMPPAIEQVKEAARNAGLAWE